MDVDLAGAQGPGDRQTAFGQLATTLVPYFVLPTAFHSAHLHPNAVGAIICNNQVLYGIFGDTNDATPQVIGAGSLLLAQTCFPNDGLSATKSHPELDVLYIVFGTVVPAGVGEATISIPDLQKVGDEQIEQLQIALKLV